MDAKGTPYLAGLQIFTAEKRRIHSSESDGSSQTTRSAKYGFSPSNTSSSDSFRVFSPLRNLSNWTTSTGYGSTPRVVDSPLFRSILPKQYDFWDGIVNEIFQNYPSKYDAKFVEEFQYLIVTSHFLNDMNGSRFSLTNKPSPILRKDIKSYNAGKMSNRIPTKFGILECSNMNEKFRFHRTLNYLPTLLRSYKILRHLQHRAATNNSLEKSRVVKSIIILTLISCHLAIQQELFYRQHIKYKSTQILRRTLDSLKRLDELLHKFHLGLKEQTIHQHLSVSFNDSDLHSIELQKISTLKSLLASSLDQLYFGMKHLVKELLPICNPNELLKYCGMYSIDMSDVLWSIFDVGITMEGKSFRAHYLKRFVLCCLLSTQREVGISTNSVTGAGGDILSQIFFTLRVQTNPSGMYFMWKISKELENWNIVILSLISNLGNYEYLLESVTELQNLATGLPITKVQNTHQEKSICSTLTSLRMIEKQLTTASSLEHISEDKRSLIIHELNEITKLLQETLFDHKLKNGITHHLGQSSVVSTPSGSKQGFHLDIFRTSPHLTKRRVDLSEKCDIPVVSDDMDINRNDQCILLETE